MNITKGNIHATWIGKHVWKCLLVSSSLSIFLATMLFGLFVFPRLSAHAQSSDWTTYLGNDEHTEFNAAETIINTTTAPNLKLVWSRKAKGRIASQPIAANGMLYWGSFDGLEHAVNPANGTTIWTANLGQTSDCKHGTLGVISSATVNSILVSGVTTPVLFVGGGNNHLYALNANTGSVIWQTSLGFPPNSFLYSSPTFYNNNVYIGVSGNDDCSKVQGQLVQIDATTGTILHTFAVVPSGCIGGSVWTSPAINESTGMLYLSVGEKGKCSSTETMAESLIELNASNLSLVGYWQVPKSQQILDGDFGASPALFSATIAGIQYQLVGLANKNGLYYTFDQNNISAGPLWQVRLGTPPGPSSATSAWDGTTLYIAGSPATINGVSCPGTLYALNPADGSNIWSDCLSFDPRGGLMAAPGLLEVGVGTSIIVFDTHTGNQLFAFQDTNSKSNFEGPGTIANGMLFHGNLDGYLYALAP